MHDLLGAGEAFGVRIPYMAYLGPSYESIVFTSVQGRARDRFLEDSNRLLKTLKSRVSKLLSSWRESPWVHTARPHRSARAPPAQKEGADLDRGDDPAEAMPVAESDGPPVRSPRGGYDSGCPLLRAVRPRTRGLFRCGRAHASSQGRERCNGGRRIRRASAPFGLHGGAGGTSSEASGQKQRRGLFAPGHRCDLAPRDGSETRIVMLRDEYRSAWSRRT